MAAVAKKPRSVFDALGTRAVSTVDALASALAKKPTVKPTVKPAAAPRAAPAKPLTPVRPTPTTVARTGTAPSGLAEAFYDPLGSYDQGAFGSAIGGHSDHVHFSFSDPQLALRTIQQAQAMGLRVGENPYVGNNPDPGVHVGNSFHYRTFPGLYNGKSLGEAIDVSGSPAQMAQLYRTVTSSAGTGGGQRVMASAGSAKAGQPLTFAQLEGLWIQAGGKPQDAATAAAVALAESSGRIDALNPNGLDYSVGPWQINYHGNLRASRTARYGTPEKLRSDPLANAKAAVDLAGSGQGWQNWSTYNSGAYKRYLSNAAPASYTSGASAPATSVTGAVMTPGTTSAAPAAPKGSGLDIAKLIAGLNAPINTAGLTKAAAATARRETADIVAVLRGQQNELHRQAAAQAAEINRASQAAATFQTGLGFGDKLAQAYRGAAGDQATLAKGFSGELQNTIGAETAKVQAGLDTIGNAGTAANTSQAAGNTVYGIGGQLPANAMLAAAPAAVAAANAYPSLLTAYGQQQGIGAIGAGNKAAQGLEPDIATALASTGKNARTILSDLVKTATTSRQNAATNVFKAIGAQQKSDAATATAAYHTALLGERASSRVQTAADKAADRRATKAYHDAYLNHLQAGDDEQAAHNAANEAAAAARISISQQSANTSAASAAETARHNKVTENLKKKAAREKKTLGGLTPATYAGLKKEAGAAADLFYWGDEKKGIDAIDYGPALSRLVTQYSLTYEDAAAILDDYYAPGEAGRPEIGHDYTGHLAGSDATSRGQKARPSKATRKPSSAKKPGQGFGGSGFQVGTSRTADSYYTSGQRSVVGRTS